MPMVRKIVVEKAGPASQLKLVDDVLPTPGPSEVLIDVEAAGVAFADVMLRLGVYPGFRPPVTPGYDVVGTIRKLGAQVSGFAVGDRVAAMMIVGGYATHVVADEAWLARAPRETPATRIVAATLNYTTAYQMLVRSAGVAPGDTILVHGAAGGVGTALLDLARHMGVRAFGTASARKHRQVSALGAEPIDYAQEDFEQVVTQRGGVRAVFDHVGGSNLVRSLRCLTPAGVVVSYGAYGNFQNGRVDLGSAIDLGLSRLRIDPLKLLAKSQALVGYGIGVERDHRGGPFQADFNAVMQLLAEDAIHPVIDSTYPLAEAAEAQRRLETAGASGKIVLTM